MDRMVLLAALAVCTPARAQWLNYPTPGIPRLADGKPNLAAPAPRAADGHPDLTGIWRPERGPCPPSGISACGEFANIGVHLPGGLPYQPWAAALVKKRTEDLGKDDPIAWCKPAGALRILTFPLYRKIVQTPAVTVILSERDVTYRQILTDGRHLPDDLAPNWNGYSVGKWQGDVLVVDTIGFRDDTWLDRNGSPMMEGAKMTEKFRRPDYGNLEIEVTVDDPKTYTKPWTIRMHQILVADTEMLDYFCNDNERDSVHAVGK